MKYNSMRGSVAFGMAATTTLLATSLVAGEYDLSGPGAQSVSVAGQFGGTAIFADQWVQPTGTGVFDPFLTLDANGQTSTGNNNIEQAYNSDAHNAPQFPDLYLDQHRPEWNTYLKVGDLAKINVGGLLYYGFLLDANEPGGNKRLISVDNIRIYTSGSDNVQSVQNDITQLDNLGTLRWAMNNPLSVGTQPPDLDGFNVENWVKLDSSQENVSHGNANGGSGQADMIVYVPVSAFGNAAATDFVWFYNLNGVHYSADADLSAQSGYEEWRAVLGPGQHVPEAGATLAMLGLALIGCEGLRRKLRK
jgi:hypothetical protein